MWEWLHTFSDRFPWKALVVVHCLVNVVDNKTKQTYDDNKSQRELPLNVYF